MRHTSLARAFAVTALVSLSVLSIATSAHAAPLTDATATSTAEIGITGTNATAVTISATAVTGAPANMFNVSLPAGWSFVTPAASCTDVTLTGFSGSTTCQLINFGASGGFASIQPIGNLSATITYSVTFAPNTLNVAGTRDFSVQLANSNTGGTAVDTGTAILAGGTPTPPAPPAPTPAPTPAEPTLAVTGNSAQQFALGAIGLLAAGAVVVISRRVRSSHR